MSTESGGIETAIAPHMLYPDVWDLADGPNPQLLRDYLRWIVSEESRFESATETMQWIPVGLFSLPVAKELDASGLVTQTLQINFYHEDYPGNEHPHAHSRPARTIWYSSPHARQIITRSLPLSEHTPRIDGLSIHRRQVVANSIIDLKDGKRPIYSPAAVGERDVLELSDSWVAPLGSQSFSSLEPHHITFRGVGVAMSVHHKGLEEPSELSSFKGLVGYKYLTTEQAEQVIALRGVMAGNLVRSESRLGPVTMIYPPQGFQLEDMQENPSTAESHVAERLLVGGLATSELLARVA